MEILETARKVHNSYHLPTHCLIDK